MNCPKAKLVLLLFASFYLFVGVPLCTCMDRQDNIGPGSPLWSQLLSAFERHTDEDKLFVETVTKSTELSLEKKLAMVLLNEWNLDPGSKQLKNPCSIYIPNENIDVEILKMLGMVILKIDVDSMGKPVNIKFIRPKNNKYKKEKEIIIEIMKKASFRPSFINNKFTSGTNCIVIRIEYHFP